MAREGTSDTPAGGEAAAGPAPPASTVSVRVLCAFAAKAGDLDLRFTPSPTAEDGLLGHREVAARRGSRFRTELRLESRRGDLLVRGRADLVDEAAALVEEVKTHRGDAARIPAHHRALHWAQAMVYGWMLCESRGLAAATVSVVYWDIDRQRESAERRELTADALRHHFEALCDRFATWAATERLHRVTRDAWLSGLDWPFDGFRDGQRTLATAVYNAARSGRMLLAQAPTGIGKTMATLFPMLKAMPGSGQHAPLDRLFFLAAKTPGRQLARDALVTLRRGRRAPLRVLALTARDKACEHPDKACHGDACPLARGFYDRLPAAREEAARALQDPDASLRDVALRHTVCPYYLAQEMARWADVIVCDYHYAFDLGALLPALAQENGWRCAALVDEAHNLVPRAREMFSANLAPERLMALRDALPASLRRAVDRVRAAWRVLDGHLADERGENREFVVLDAPPAAFTEPLRGLVSRIGDWLAEQPQALSGEALQFHFDALHFLELADALDAHGQFDLQRRRGRLRHGRLELPESLPCVRNVVPAPFLKPRFDELHTTVLFSATLAPPQYHARLLGVPDDAVRVDVDSPFDAAQLRVEIARDVSTRFRDRGASLPRVARRIVAQYRAQPGNYLAFFASFEYLDQVYAAVAAMDPTLPLQRQERAMAEPARAAFVASFAEGGRQIGFAVLGGAFAEGIDLPGTRLVGAFVATLGLPQVNPVNESIRARLQVLFGDGYAFGYLYPGLQKVVQAAGRVIRTPQDRGVVHLIDDRFARSEVAALLPSWWQVVPAVGVEPTTFRLQGGCSTS